MVEMGYEWPMNFSHFIFDQIHINDKIEKLAHCFYVNQESAAKEVVALNMDSGRKFDM